MRQLELVTAAAPCVGRRGLCGAVLAPVDLRSVRAVQHLGAARLREVGPEPVDEGFDPGAHAGHQHGVHPKPRYERDRSVDLAAFLAHRRDRRATAEPATADHRHDALVPVLERLPLARRRSPRAGSWQPRRRSAGQRSRAVEGISLLVPDVGDVAHRIEAREALRP